MIRKTIESFIASNATPRFRGNAIRSRADTVSETADSGNSRGLVLGTGDISLSSTHEVQIFELEICNFPIIHTERIVE